MSPQQTIAHYRITAKLGEGGMGEVYRATDTKLGRDVAIKVLPEAFAQDPDRMARFAREAQVLASLNHPNIAAIYGVEERALMMEMVEGQTLAERIAAGPMPLEEALPIARQIAEALEYAHERGVVHRDLKPANIKITPEHRVKVLDFGLAKAMSGDAAAADPTVSPTLTMRATVVGTLMGTAAYMSPEQARGQAVDRRADIWAFGVVLYEMLTGRQLFGGPTVSDTLAGVLKGDLDLAAIPARVRPVVEGCLRRDPRSRWRSVGDVLLLLEAGAQAGAAVAALALIAAVLAAGLWRATRPVDRPLVRLNVDLGVEAIPGLSTTVALSPDGRRLVFPARAPDGKHLLATRLFDQAQSTFLAGTEFGFDPFFSPDSQWVGFFTGDQLKKIPAQGGAPQKVCPAQNNSRGASWGPDGTIVAAFQQLLSLKRVPAAGGVPRSLTKLEGGAVTHRWPQVLPGGEAVLFTASPTNTYMDDADIEAISLKTGQTKVVQPGGYYGRYLPGGHLVFVHQGVLLGVGFDADRLEVRGTPLPLVEDLAANPITGGGQFDFSDGGTFVYVAGKGTAQTWQIAWLDASGKMQPLVATPGAYTLPRFSPDGLKLAFSSGSDVYVQDLERDTTNKLASYNGIGPIWTPDGKHIVLRSGTAHAGAFSVSWLRSDGAAEPQALLETQDNTVPWSFSPDGRRLAYFENSPEHGFDLWTVPLDITDLDHPKAGKPELFLSTPHDEMVPRFSPDGRWIAYRSNESGIDEVYVRPFPAVRGGKWQISSGGGLYGIWSNDGHELFYESPDSRIMVVDYTVEGDTFVPGKRRVWSDKPLFYPGNSNLDLAPDGKRFAVLTTPEGLEEPHGSLHVTFLLNFFDELRRKLPPK